MENQIKEQQLLLFADRTRCHDFLTDPFRLLLSSFAKVLIETRRRVHLAGPELAAAQVNTIRLKILKVAARVVCSVRRLVFHLSRSDSNAAIFRRIAASLRLQVDFESFELHLARGGSEDPAETINEIDASNNSTQFRKDQINV